MRIDMVRIAKRNTSDTFAPKSVEKGTPTRRPTTPPDEKIKLIIPSAERKKRIAPMIFVPEKGRSDFLTEPKARTTNRVGTTKYPMPRKLPK